MADAPFRSSTRASHAQCLKSVNIDGSLNIHQNRTIHTLTNMAEPNVLEMLEQLDTALRALPGISVTEKVMEEHLRTHDARLELLVDGKPVHLMIEFKKTVLPREAKTILWQLRPYLEPAARQRGVCGLVIANLVSAGARQMLEEERVGYFDSSGSLYLPAPGALIYIERPPTRVAKRRLSNIFSARRAQVAHAVLHEALTDRGRWFGVNELAPLAGVSVGTVSESMTLFERMEWMESRGEGPSKERQLTKPGELLDAWAAAFVEVKRPMQRYFVPLMKDTGQLIERIADVFNEHLEGQYAITHQAAAQHYSPFMTQVPQVRCRALQGRSLEQAIKVLGAQEVSSGSNFALWPVPSEGELRFHQVVGGVHFASLIHTYLDLLQGADGRSPDVARHLRSERIGF